MKRLFLFVVMSVAVLCSSAQELSNEMIKILYTENIITNFYVDAPDEAKIAEAAVKGMLKELDPHSTYTDPKETKALMEQMQGSFGGIGVQFNVISDTLYVIEAVNGGPSQKAGILPGDRIVLVNDTAIAGVKIKRDEIMTRLRGEKGTKVKLGIVRRGVDKLLNFYIVRDDITTETVDAAYMVDSKVGYIRLSSFGAKSYDEIVYSLDSLKSLGMKSLILDLEGNGGGFLDAAVEIASEFLEDSKLVVYTEGRVNPRYDNLSRGYGSFTEGNLAVIIDETSASAAEILAGAIQDWDRGVVVGRRSFGKGLVQRPFQLPDGSMIRLTIARYYTPTGRCIQKPYNDSIKYEDDLLNRYNSGEMITADSIHFPDSLKTYTLRLERPVYGGGGIMPDYFVPMDTSKYSDYHRELSSKGCIAAAPLLYLDVKRQELLAKYKNVDEFDKNFVVDDEYIAILTEYAKKEGVEPKGGEEEFERSLPEIKKQLKLLLARDLWDFNDFIKMYNKQSNSFKKAYELVRKRNMDKVLMKE